MGESLEAEDRKPMAMPAPVAGSPLGFLALEAGWVVSEMGRQPWTIYQLMRTSESVTPVNAVPTTLAVFAVVYLALGATLIVLLLKLAGGTPVVVEPPVRPDVEAGHDA